MRCLLDFYKYRNSKLAKRWRSGDLRYCEGAHTREDEWGTEAVFHGFLYDRKAKTIIDPGKMLYPKERWSWLIMRSWGFKQLSRTIKNGNRVTGGLPIASGVDSWGTAIHPDHWDDIEAQVRYDPPFP